MRNLRPVSDVAPRAIIYVRQSTYKEESISLELQEIACRDYCERLGYEVISVEEDPGVSGRTWNRRGVQTVMAAIEDHRADVIVLWKWSRLSRSRKDWALAIDRCDIAGGRIESATEPIDTATASGRFARGVMTEFSAYQSELIGEVWEDVRQRRLRKGLPASGRLPFGWRWVKGEGIEPHPAQAPFIPEMYRRYLAGDGAAAIAAWLNSSGVPGPNGNPWTRVRPLTVLDSPIHAGMIPYRGETHQGAHQALIEAPVWRAYLTERARRRQVSARPRNHDHLLSGLVTCACGARMHGKGAITGGRWYGGYLCSDTLRGHAEKAYVSALTLDPLITAWFLEFDVEVRPEGAGAAERAQRDRLLRRLNELETELVAAARGSLRDQLPVSAYERLVAELRAEHDAVRNDLDRVERNAKASPSPDAITHARTVWPAATVNERNRALRTVIARVQLQPTAGAVIHTTWGDSSVLTF